MSYLSNEIWDIDINDKSPPNFGVVDFSIMSNESQDIIF